MGSHADKSIFSNSALRYSNLTLIGRSSSFPFLSVSVYLDKL